MLVLSVNSSDRRVFIDVNGVRIIVSLENIKGKSVKLGFEAPKEAVILRESLVRK